MSGTSKITFILVIFLLCLPSVVYPVSKKALSFERDKKINSEGEVSVSGGSALGGKAPRELSHGVYSQEDHVERLIQNLQSENLDVRRRAAWALGEIKDPEAIGFLIAAIKDENRSVQINAIDALGRMGALAVGPLIEALKNDDRPVRLGAAKALRKIKDPGAVELLTTALEDKNSYVRLNVAWALGSIKDPKAIEPLIEALKDRNSYVRKNAAWAMGKIKDSRAIEPLTEALMDNNSDVRENAVWALRMIKDPLAVGPLITVLKDDNQRVRKNAIEALEEITGENFGQDTLEWQKWWEQNKKSKS